MSEPGSQRSLRHCGRLCGRLWGRHWLWGWLGVLVVLLSGPVLTRRGFVLRGDMVFVPRQPWKPGWYGGDGGIPRAVPSDALVSLATRVLPGDLLQAVILLAIPLVAGSGVLLMTRTWHPAAALAATTIYVWNPYVDERWGIGHWALLCGYAALPWVLLTATKAARRESLGWWAFIPALALAAGTSPTGGLMAGILAVSALAVGGGWRLGLVGVGVSLLANLPWLAPSVLAVPGTPADPFGVEAFAARADTPWGLLASLATFGGIWKESVVSPVRDDAVLSLAALALTAIGLIGAGWAVRARRPESPLLVPAAIAGLPLLLGAWVLSTSWGAAPARWLVVTIPGGGVLRDTQKWVAPFCLLVALGLGAAVEWLVPRLQPRKLVWSAYAVAVLPMLLLPTLAWGRLGEWRPTPFPAEWGRVAGQLDRVGNPDDRLVVLPFTVYRRYSWNGEVAMLDPAPRFFPGQVITDDELGISQVRSVAGESPLAARIREVRADPEALASVLQEQRVRWVLEQKGTPGEGHLPDGVGIVVHEGPELRLIELPMAAPGPGPRSWARGLLAIDAVILAGVAVAGAGCLARLFRRRRSVP